jgi:hypothetical protein
VSPTLIPTEPTPAEIAEREAISLAFFDPNAAAAARDAFLKRAGQR